MEPSGKDNFLEQLFLGSWRLPAGSSKVFSAGHGQRNADICQFGAVLGVIPWLHQSCCP